MIQISDSGSRQDSQKGNMEKQNSRYYDPRGRRMLEKRPSETEGELSEEN